MKNFETVVQETRQNILEAIKQRGIYTASTCNTFSFGWDADIHKAHEVLQRRGIPGIWLTREVKFEVTDWTATYRMEVPVPKTIHEERKESGEYLLDPDYWEEPY